MWFICLYLHFSFCSICGCEAGTTIWKIRGGGGGVKYWEVWSRYCGLISNTVAGLSVVKKIHVGL